MTAVIHHGPPGSFKSFGTIQRAIIPALIKGRLVVTNIRGFDSIEKIENAMGVEIPPESQLVYVDADSEKGFEAMRRFHHWVPDGALIAIDEVQRVWSKKRHRDLKQFDLKLTDHEGEYLDAEVIQAAHPMWDGSYDRPETLETAIDQHRHNNWDIYCTTPNISKVHPEVRETVEVAYRHRAMGALLPWWRNKWKEFTHDAETSGKSLSHYLGSPKPYKADTRIFATYKSTKTGKALGTSESRPIYRDPKLQMVFGALAILTVSFVHSAINFYDTSPLFDKNRDAVGVVDEQAGRSRGGDGDGDAGDIDPVEARLKASFDSVGRSSSADRPSRLTVNQVLPFAASGFLARYVDDGYQIRLGALVTRADSSLSFVIVVEDDQDSHRIDQIDQKQLSGLGYTYRYSDAGLYVTGDSERYLVRPFGFVDLDRINTREGAAMQTRSRGDMVKDKMEVF